MGSRFATVRNTNSREVFGPGENSVSSTPLGTTIASAPIFSRMARARNRLTAVTRFARRNGSVTRSEEHTSELQSLRHLVCRLLLEKKKRKDAKCRTRAGGW